MQVQFTNQGFYLPEIDLWLDPQEQCRSAWLSHAHSDHARGLHCDVIGTPETLAIYRLRWPEQDNITQQLRHLSYGESLDWQGARLTAYPASHIVGAAQLLVEYKKKRLVYTGDIKVREPICGTTTRFVKCDRLIVESTFGLPIFHFLDRQRSIEKILAFAQECLDEGISPVFIGYPLGRGQEIVHVLCQAGIPTAVHGSIARLIPAYQSAGYSFPGWMPYYAKETAGKALVVVPGFRAYLEAAARAFEWPTSLDGPVWTMLVIASGPRN